MHRCAPEGSPLGGRRFAQSTSEWPKTLPQGIQGDRNPLGTPFSSIFRRAAKDGAAGGTGSRKKNQASKTVKKPTKKSDIPIYKRGESGEIALKKAYGGGHKTFNTSGGKRVVDVFANGIAHESKVGYVSKTQFIQKQIEKDVELVQTGKIKAAHWHFYRSPTTGKIGASRPLLKLLDDCNIKVTIHY